MKKPRHWIRSYSGKTMNSDLDKELISFASGFLESHGAALEVKNKGLDVILPEKLSDILKVPEYIHIRHNADDESGDLYSIHYGAPLLDKMIQAACAEIPLLSCELRFDYIKSGGFERLISDQFHFSGISGRVQSFANVKTDYLVFYCRYNAQSDEQKEGMTTLAFNFETGAFIPYMTSMPTSAEKKFGAERKMIWDEKRLDQIIKQVKIMAEKNIMEEVLPFRESTVRRFRRDISNLDEYYTALEKEMRLNLSKQGLSDVLLNDRKEKIDMLPHELKRKMDDLSTKYNIRIRVDPCAILLIRIPAVKILYAITVHAKKSTLSFIYNPVMKAIDPLVCKGCGTSITDVYRCNNLHILCHKCRESCPVCNRK